VAGAVYEPLSQAIARDLREAILDGRIAPGERIRQEAVAKELGASRIPVREALAQLETEGLVTIVPHSGARAARPVLAEMVELYKLREELEPLAIAEAVAHVGDAELARLTVMAHALERAPLDLPAFLRDDRAFHLASYAAAPMPRLLGMIEDLWNATQQYRRLYVRALGPGDDVGLGFLEHRLIIDALERRDEVEARSLVASHVRRTRQSLSAHPEAFR
jgi:DNA-binding GntR family transcriptional regulator